MNKALDWLIRRRSTAQALAAVALNSSVTQQVTRGLPCPALNCHACPVASFACPIGALQHFVGLRVVPFYTLGAVALVGALVGRMSCGWLCPFGWVQDLLFRLPVPKLRLPNRFSWGRYVTLAVLVLAIPFVTGQPWFCKLCPAGTLEAGIPVVLFSPPLHQLIGALYGIKLFLLFTLVAWMSVTRRPFCRWICPLGALWSAFNPVSAFQLSVNLEDCIECDRCQTVCPVDIRVYADPSSAACIRCLQCIQVCPTQCIRPTALHWTAVDDASGGHTVSA